MLEKLVNAIEARSAEGVLNLVHTLLAEGRNLQHFCREAIRHFRDLLVARVSGADSDLIAALPEQRPGLERAAAKFSEEDLTRFFQILLSTDEDLRRKPDPRLHLEMGLLRLVNAARLAPLEEVLAELRGGGSAAAPARTSGPIPGGGIASQQAVPLRASAATASAGPSMASSFSAAPAMPRAQGPVAVSLPSVVARAAGQFDGIDAAKVDAIKSAILGQQKFLGELVEHVCRWELEGAEMRLYFPTDRRALADLLQARDPMEKLRTISSKVVGQPLRVCVRLESSQGMRAAPGADAGAPELRARFEQDPIVRAMLQRFGGRISEVKRRPEE
jgi:hypothetical protein